MMSDEPDVEQPHFDPHRIIEVLDAHHVDYLIVGGIAANSYGAVRPTDDFDCLADKGPENLDRLAGAMRELRARLRVQGLSDAESAALPVVVDAQMLGWMEISTWRTDAGDFDVLTDIPARDGTRRRYEDLIGNAVEDNIVGITVHVADLDDIIASKQWANRPKDHLALPELERIAHRRNLGQHHGPDAGFDIS